MKTKIIPKMVKDIPNLNQGTIKTLTQLIFREEKPKIPNKVDLIFLFGSTSSTPERKKVLDKLLKKNICDKVLLSGGINPRRKKGSVYEGKFHTYNLSKISEAEILEKELELNKFKKLKVYKEEKSTSTLENVKFSLNILDFKNFKNILFITRSYHVGRCYLTLKKYLPNNIDILYKSYDSQISKKNEQIITRDNWHKFADGRRRVLAEFARIKIYGGENKDIAFDKKTENLVNKIKDDIKKFKRDS